MQQSKRFNARAFASVTLGLSGLGLPITGLANHALAFEPLTMARHAWMSAHNSLGIVFVVASIWHVWLNRRPLWSHLRNAAANAAGVSREALLALAVVAFSLLFTGHAFLAM
jgi:uncharacterized iron-regulated membrane protein